MAPVSNNITKLVTYFIIVNVISWARGELFTAMSDMEPLLETQKRIIQDLEDYIYKEEKRLALLKRHLNVYKKEQNSAMLDIANYLSNPINAFTLIKRLTTDLEHMKESIEVGIDYIELMTMTHEDLKYPTQEDLTGAAQALTRLQDTYRLNIEDLAEGKLKSTLYSNETIQCTPMSAGDCFELGMTLYLGKDFKNALTWFNMSLRKYREEGINYPFSEVRIMEHMANAHKLSGDVISAYEWTMKIIEIDPRHQRAVANVLNLQKMLAQQEAKLKKKGRKDSKVGKAKEEQPVLSEYSKEVMKRNALCRGEVGIPSEISKRLYCRYLTENHPFLRLAPFKMEYYYRDPDIIVFHEVMSDDEIEYIKKMAKPRLERAVILNLQTGYIVQSPFRISKSTCLHDNESEIIRTISRRVHDLTNLAMDTAEHLQVINYGIGGQYDSHYDFLRKSDPGYTDLDDNRIATVMFYMSAVAQGGATVFTELGLSVQPIKGAALFWMNLHPSGEGDLATKHAACPVLIGSKWVSNKWIRQTGQEFIKPCSLEYQKEGIARKIPQPVPKKN